MRTLVRVQNANCSWCMNSVRDALLARPLVTDVELHPVEGCWAVDHDHDDPDELCSVLSQSLHGWTVQTNGEVVQVATDPGIVGSCDLHPPDDVH